MKKLALALAASVAFAFSAPAVSATMDSESYEAQATASDAAVSAHEDMIDAFGKDSLKPGEYLWRDIPESAGDERVVVSLSDQIAYVYRGNRLMAVASTSTGRPGHDTPTGVFEVMNKEPMHHSRKYDDAPMPWMEQITDYGVALHAGYNPGHPDSHGCIRLPSAFAKKLYSVTSVGTPVLVGT
jgi:lipoprotein-anchoring transpeptidase ErfK/SrfK